MIYDLCSWFYSVRDGVNQNRHRLFLIVHLFCKVYNNFHDTIFNILISYVSLRIRNDGHPPHLQSFSSPH